MTDIDGTYRCVIDRIVDGQTAVLLIEEDGETIAERTCPVETVPNAARHDGAIVTAQITEQAVEITEYHPDHEQQRRERLQKRFNDLSRRLGEDE